MEELVKASALLAKSSELAKAKAKLKDIYFIENLSPCFDKL